MIRAVATPVITINLTVILIQATAMRAVRTTEDLMVADMVAEDLMAVVDIIETSDAMKIYFPGRRICRSVALAALLIVNLISRAHASPPGGYKLDWSDEFNGSSLDTNKWIHWLPGKRRHAVNTPDAVTIRNGCLTITSYTKAGQHFTGMISTEKKFEPVHGYWEARIHFEDSPGEWSAFWLQSPTMGRPIGDTATAGIEIDICEHRSVSKEGENIAGKVHHTLHWDGYGRSHQTKGQLTPEMKLDEGFHVYGFEWTDSAYRFFVDGQLTWTVTNAISNAKEFAILSAEIDDSAWAGKIPPEGYGDYPISRTRMVVDYVRYYTHEVAAAKPVAR